MINPRTPERLRHHYEVERELAAKLRKSSRAERMQLFETLYAELFDRVPDHPRLLRRETQEESRSKVEGQLRLLRPFLRQGSTLLEIAPGDCRLAHAASSLCEKVIGMDISDQQSAAAVAPPNFIHKVYDGYQIDLPDGIADVAFSYQFLEHLHPDDVEPHLRLVHRLLKPSGRYIIGTPHRFSGPHDISGYFGDELVCFHFQEWTFRSLQQALKSVGFSRIRIFRGGKLRPSRIAALSNMWAEDAVALLPPRMRKAVSGRLYQAVTLVAER
jgi:SAM-dependent methyltransferase